MKPKVWGDVRLTEAIAVGEARARFNQTIDAPYQTASGPGFAANKVGPFSSVTVTGGKETKVEPSLFCNGTVNDKLKRKGATIPGSPFYSTTIRTHTYNLGNGYSSEVVGEQPYTTYTRRVFVRVDESDASNLVFGHYSGTKNVQFYKRGFIGSYEQDFQTVEYTFNVVGHTLWQYEPVGRTSKAHQANNFFFYTMPNGTTNEWGMPLVAPQFVRVEDNCTVGSTAWLPILPEPERGNRNYHLGPSFCYGPDKVGLFVIEVPLDAKFLPAGPTLDWIWANESDHSQGTLEAPYNAQGRILLYLSDNGGTSWDIVPFTGLDYIVYPDSPGRPEPFLGYFWLHNQPNYWATFYGDIGLQGMRLADFATTSNVAVFSEAVFVVFFVMADFRTYGGISPGAVGFSFRTDDRGATWTKIDTPLSTEVPPHVYDCTTTVLRQGVALTRCPRDMAGLNRNVRWLKTVDAGVTWTEIEPVGLPASTNERIGYPEVFKVELVEGLWKTDMGLVCYSDDDQAYVMYRSKDDGYTWYKDSTVQRSTDVIRCDADRMSGPYAFPNLNFGVLDYRGTIEKPQPLDVAQPWRYDALIPPP